jgi:hypothetical protein
MEKTMPFGIKGCKTFLQAHGFDVWQSVVDGYVAPTTPPTDKDGKKLSENNSKAKGTILSSLDDSVFVKVMHCKTTKDLWDKLQNIYEGDTKVKGAKLQTLRAKFEQLKMKEDEDIAAYFLRVDETMNTIRGLGEEVDESVVIQKVLRSLPIRFDPKISSLEERTYLDSLSMDELHGIFTAYEMRIEQENPVTKEATFKASKKTKKKNKKKSKPDCSCNDDSEEDEEVENFVRKLKRGTNKYKGMLPLKCFNCDGIGHFSSKCPYAKNKGSDEEEDPKKKKKNQKGDKRRNKNKFFKKSFYSKEDNSSSDEDDDSDNDSERVLFMEVEDDEEDSEYSEEEGEVDLREELISALEELGKERKKIKSLKAELKKKEGSQNSNSEEVEQIITKVKDPSRRRQKD